MIKKQVFYRLVFIMLPVISCISFASSATAMDLGQVTFPEQDLKISIEIAESEQQRMKGLMFREFLPINNGMLFIFNQEQLQKVWMKNTLMALDIVFISNKGMVVSTLKEIQPCIQTTPCPIYNSKVKAKYMLEINSGMVEKAGIHVGQQLIFERL